MNDVTVPAYAKVALMLTKFVSLSGSTKCQPHVPLGLVGHEPVVNPGFFEPTCAV